MKHVRGVSQERGQIRVLNARFDERELRVPEQRAEIPLLRRARIVIGEAVDADDLVAVGKEALCQSGSDEAGGAGHQRSHVKSVHTGWGSRRGRPLRPRAACTVVPVASIVLSAARATSYENWMRTGDTSVPAVRTSSKSS